MTLSPTSSTISSADLATSLELVEVKPGMKFSLGVLRSILPDAETVLFFAKAFDLDYIQLSTLMSKVLTSSLAAELFGGDHSLELQDYLVGYEDDYGVWHDGVVPPHERGNVTLAPDVPHGEILPQVWESMQVEIATSIKEVAAKLQSTFGLMPGKQGEMVMQSMMKLNLQRPTLGVHKARVHHAPQKENLVILDVSGSMTSQTVGTIVDDVVALSYMANAHLAIVSDRAFHWEPGSYDSQSVLSAAEFSGTHYEKLHQLLDRDWGVVVTIADYDSSMGAKNKLSSCKGSIDQVFDISLVNRPSFLAECVGQLAVEVKPLLVANSQYVLGSGGYSW